MTQPIKTPARFLFSREMPKAKRRFTKGTLLGRPLRRKDSGTTATNFRGRARVKRLRLRKLQRIARRRNRPV
jgi:hypothetical protein